jgi:hypothetical protein
MRSAASLSFLLVACTPVFAQPPAGGWPSPLPVTVGPPPVPPVTDGLPPWVVEYVEYAPERAAGQQHWVALNLMLGQPSVARLGVKVWDRPNNSIWLETYGGSALFDGMYGFGVRLQHTAWTFGNGDSILVAPGLGVHILPDWTTYYHHGRHHGYYGWYGGRNTLTYLAADVDIAWLHDFSPRFGYELGVKLGFAARLSGDVGDDYPGGVMWGRNAYPIVGVYTGLRF